RRGACKSRAGELNGRARKTRRWRQGRDAGRARNQWNVVVQVEVRILIAGEDCQSLRTVQILFCGRSVVDAGVGRTRDEGLPQPGHELDAVDRGRVLINDPAAGAGRSEHVDLPGLVVEFDDGAVGIIEEASDTVA